MFDNSFDYQLHYRNWHDDSAGHAEVMISHHMKQLAPFLPPSRDAEILDIGCGMGFALLALSRLGFHHLHGVDSDPAQVASCQGRRLSVSHVQNVERYLAHNAHRFDVVLLLDVLEHIAVKRQIAVMRHAHESLREGGRAILQVPNASSIIAARWRYIDHTHNTSFTEYSLRFVLMNAGFAHITVQPTRITRPSFRFWTPAGRNSLLHWLFRKTWQKILQLEQVHENAAIIPLDPNMLAVAYKA